jgi:hypothetical protein
MPHVAEGAGSPFRQPLSKARNAGEKRHPGGFSFGDFSLAKQRKVTRLSVREPTYKIKPRDSESSSTPNKANVDLSTTTTATKKIWI